MITLYHNPRCSKSRAALALLQENGIEPDIVLYLDNPPSERELKSVLKKLGLGARDLLRRGEEEYRELGLADTGLSDATLVSAMSAHPRLIERPIAIRGDHAVIGRPPENVLELL